jgi:heterodisulfide reductase subunit A-like polyferredoxin
MLDIVSADGTSLVDGGARSAARKAVIVGAGPVGCLTAISLSKQGWRVDVYESRHGTCIVFFFFSFFLFSFSF